MFDVTKFLAEHPGGKQAILQFAGKDVSEEWNMIHAPNTTQIYADKIIELGPVAADDAHIDDACTGDNTDIDTALAIALSAVSEVDDNALAEALHQQENQNYMVCFPCTGYSASGWLRKDRVEGQKCQLCENTPEGLYVCV